jgi:hypothetical protein
MDQDRNPGQGRKQDRDLDRPNQTANKEPAEGSRENVGDAQDKGRGQPAAGITNRPLEEEEQEQSEVPPRGRTKEEEDRLDVGRTTGGGSLGHDQPPDVKRSAPIRNATGSNRDPVMPEDDATLKTKI